jgi:hypothetical protein
MFVGFVHQGLIKEGDGGGALVFNNLPSEKAHLLLFTKGENNCYFNGLVWHLNKGHTCVHYLDFALMELILPNKCNLTPHCT